MKSFIITLVLSLCWTLITPSSLQAQVVATVDGREISQTELLYAFNKNRKEGEPIVLDSLESYLEQFINFKLKVNAARSLGLDTLSAFQEELEGYISQIKKPYLDNPLAEEELLLATYERMQYDLNASHILIKISPTALPADTLKAFNFLDSLRNTIGSKVEFEEMAKRFSQDGSAQQGGKLGWFTAMQMVAPFEETAYKTEVGKVSDIVRSNFGYHLIYLNDKRPNHGKVKTSHIFFTIQRGREQAFQLAKMVYDSLQNGADWDKMVRKYSDDGGTKADGGKLPWAGVKQLPDEFLEIAYSIENLGDYTIPQETPFGWHIIKLNDYQPLEPFEIKKSEIALLLKRMGRNTLGEDKLIAKLKVENQFNQNLDSLNHILNRISQSNKAEVSNSELAKKIMFQHGNLEFRVEQFLETLPGFKIQYPKEQLADFYQKFEKDAIIAYEDSIAPSKYPEYRLLMQEYEEGLLLFEVMQRKVWDKAVEDSLGLEKFYQSNLKKYQIEDRLSCLCVDSPSEEVKEILGSLSVHQDSLPGAENIIKVTLAQNNAAELKIAKRALMASDLSNFEVVKNQLGIWTSPNDSNDFCLIQSFLPAGPQPLNEIKGIVMSDYQEKLDQDWIKELRDSAKIKVNKKALKAILNN